MAYPSVFSACILGLLLIVGFGAGSVTAKTVDTGGVKPTMSAASADLSSEDRRQLDAYRKARREAATLALYNKHLQQLIDSQKKEEVSLTRQIDELAVTRRQLVPLMYRMLDSLETFVRLDVPFLKDERDKRLRRLREMMVRPAVDDSEKYRRILEAFQIEDEYGHSIEAYRADLAMNGETRPVDFLRLGRVALYYQTLDGTETGVWENGNKEWKVLSSEYRKPVRDGLRIARKQASPTLLTLPVPAPEVVR